jgi:hypothetical protein
MTNRDHRRADTRAKVAARMAQLRWWDLQRLSDLLQHTDTMAPRDRTGKRKWPHWVFDHPAWLQQQIYQWPDTLREQVAAAIAKQQKVLDFATAPRRSRAPLYLDSPEDEGRSE